VSGSHSELRSVHQAALSTACKGNRKQNSTTHTHWEGTLDWSQYLSSHHVLEAL
jgi:hypothetical protein